MAQTITNGIRITYDDLGQGEPALLFMPGWCANRTVFQDLITRTSRCRRTLAIDWRGHGESAPAKGDFGSDDLLDDALAVIQTSEVKKVVPVALAHSGWVAIKLRERLGERIPKLVHLEWIILDAPPPFLQALKGMQSPNQWKQTIDQFFSQWLHGVDNPRLIHFVKEEMGSYGFEMWSRAAREIHAAYTQEGNPLKALSRLKPPIPVLHLCVPSADPGYLPAQQSFAAAHPWFTVRRLEGHSHFPTFEVPDSIASAVEQFVQ